MWSVDHEVGTLISQRCVLGCAVSERLFRVCGWILIEYRVRIPAQTDQIVEFLCEQKAKRRIVSSRNACDILGEDFGDFIITFLSPSPNPAVIHYRHSYE